MKSGKMPNYPSQSSFSAAFQVRFFASNEAVAFRKATPPPVLQTHCGKIVKELLRDIFKLGVGEQDGTTRASYRDVRTKWAALGTVLHKARTGSEGLLLPPKMLQLHSR